MNVTVRLHATLRRPTPDGYQNRLRAELDDGATVGTLLSSLEIGMAPELVIAVVNRRQVASDYSLGDGDEVHLFPPISGGLTLG